MTSFVSWLDHSEDDQRRIREILQLFSDRGTVDDLGLGTIRDGLSNLFFPGTSVIQTRARYYLFLPWTFRHFEKAAPHQLLPKANDFQRKFIAALREGGDEPGIIGRNAGASLKTLPSSIYWNGMARYGIFTMPGLTQSAYGRRVARGLSAPTFEEEVTDRSPSYWHRDIPDPPDGFFKLHPTDLSLTRDEASWLSERICSTDGPVNDSSLLASMVRALRPGDEFVGGQVWEAPLPPNVSVRMTRLLHHAERFSYAAQGTALLYNLMLSELRTDSDASTDNTSAATYAPWIDSWSEEADRVQLRRWADDLPELWDLLLTSGTRVSPGTKAFVDAWAELIKRDGPNGLGANDAARVMIRQRELAHKRGQARFANPKRVSAWEGLAGTTLMAYRWPLVRNLLTDISKGLGRSADSEEVPHVVA